MFRFLRKYNRWILAVGGTLLMVVFLIPTAIQGLAQRAAISSAVWATVGTDGEEVSQPELIQIQQELLAIQNMQAADLPGLGNVDQPAHWYLLVREAEAAGLVPGTGTIYASLQAPRDQTLSRLAGIGRTSTQQMLRLLSRIEGVTRLARKCLAPAKFSDRRLRHHARRLLYRVDAEMVVIKASRVDDAPDPDEDEIERHMAEFAGVRPGEGEKGFGYLLPDRAKLEWLTVSADAVRRMVESGDQLNGVALRKHWRLNPDARFPDVTDGASVPEVVRTDLLETLTQATLAQIAKFASDQLRTVRRGLRTNEGYLVLPDDWTQRRLDLQRLAQRIQAEFAIDLPIYQTSGEGWLAPDDVAALQGIGAATTDKFGPTPIPLGDLVVAAKEFGGSTALIIQERVAGPPLRGREGDVHFFRIIATDASRPPDSVDEVRDEVVADLCRLAHYDALVDSIDEIEEAARNRGLLALAVEHDTPIELAANITLYDLARGTASPLPTIGADRETVETIIDRALGLVIPEGTTVADLPPEDRVFAVPVEDQLSVVVVRLTRLSPLTSEQFVNLVSSGTTIQNLILADEVTGDDAFLGAFSFDALAERHNFSLVVAATQPATAPAVTSSSAP